MSFILVFIGGLCGAITRFEFSHRWNGKLGFPLGTALANVSGGMLLGLLIRIQESLVFPEWMWLLLATGFCGGYTTYSTFSYETYQFIQKQKWLEAGIYMFGSISATLLGVWMLLQI